MNAAVLLSFLLLPPILQLLALLLALRKGVAGKTLILASVVLAAALVGAGVVLDVGGTGEGGESSFPVADWMIGALLGVAIILETSIVVGFHGAAE